MFYRLPEPDILQGDIFDGVPHLFLRSPLNVLRKVMLAGGREAYGFYEYPPPTPESRGGPEGQPPSGGPFHVSDGEDALAFCQVSRAIVINHDCDIENDQEHRVIALVRPLAPILNPEHQAVIRENRNFSYFFLPEEGTIPASYVDFRRITSLSHSFLNHASRVTALTQESVSALQYAFFRFLTHRDVILPPG